MSDWHLNDAPAARPGGDTEATLSDLDLALADWARRHGADRLVARAFALSSWAVAQGHTCLDLADVPHALMSADNQAALADALAASALVGTAGQSRPLIVDRGKLYLQRYHAYEARLAARLRELMSTPPAPVNIEALRPGNGLFVADPHDASATNWQAVAAFAALRHRFTVISGGPGTGKTYTIVRLLRVLIETALKQGDTPPLIALAAPTGKAAARMLESVRTGLDDMGADPTFDASAIDTHVPRVSRTLHRLLGLAGATTRPRFDADNPLGYDVVIVDEASMVDLPMMAKLAEAVPRGARLILLGDRYQLASVESGAVLAELCAAAGVNRFTRAQQDAAAGLLAAPAAPVANPLADHVVTLQTSRRFNADSAIGQLAAAVNAGQPDTALALLDAGYPDLVYHDSDHPAALERLVEDTAERYARLRNVTDPSLALAELSRQIILTAVRHGPAGNHTLNAAITERLARRLDFAPTQTWYHGRPIMIRRNDYRTGLYNGDVGIALAAPDGRLRVWIAADDGLKAFIPSALPAHETVYAMTVHKSQGSEFDAVSLVLPPHDTPVLSRELLYTGITRARSKLSFYGPRHAVRDVVTTHTQRASNLAALLDSGA